jgi:predicted hydrocarbon binding protein
VTTEKQVTEKRKELQEVMNFATALSYALEKILGRGATGMTFVAGRKLGKQFSQEAHKTTDLQEALIEVRRLLQNNDFLWEFESYRKSSQPDLVTVREDGAQEMQLVFRDCMIRQSLFCYGHEQKGSLCSMMYGFFSGALENITGKRSTLEIIHAGQNACLKKLVLS